MKDGMSKSQKLFCSNVKSFYTSELIYYEQFMPKPDSLNQVYFPVCKNTLDKDGLISWLKSEDVSDEQIEWLSFSLFMKDLPVVLSSISS